MTRCRHSWTRKPRKLVVFETIDLGAASSRSQMMLLCGIALLIWVMFRSNIRSKQLRRRDDAELTIERKKWQSRKQSGAPLADAPADVARWQAGMFDLQRELRAELDTRIAVVQSLVRLADQRIGVLQRLSEDPPGELRIRAERIETLARGGKTPIEIASELGMSVGDVEFLMSVAKTSPAGALHKR